MFPRPVWQLLFREIANNSTTAEAREKNCTDLKSL